MKESFRDVASDNFSRVFSGKERCCKGIKFFLQFVMICNEEFVSKSLRENNALFAFESVVEVEM